MIGNVRRTPRAVSPRPCAPSSRLVETAMIDVVNCGGDADTTGVILGMVAGPS
jgi:hypothetical protein